MQHQFFLFTMLGQTEKTSAHMQKSNTTVLSKPIKLNAIAIDYKIHSTPIN